MSDAPSTEAFTDMSGPTVTIEFHPPAKDIYLDDNQSSVAYSDSSGHSEEPDKVADALPKLAEQGAAARALDSSEESSAVADALPELAEEGAAARAPESSEESDKVTKALAKLPEEVANALVELAEEFANARTLDSSEGSEEVANAQAKLSEAVAEAFARLAEEVANARALDSSEDSEEVANAQALDSCEEPEEVANPQGKLASEVTEALAKIGEKVANARAKLAESIKYAFENDYLVAHDPDATDHGPTITVYDKDTDTMRDVAEFAWRRIRTGAFRAFLVEHTAALAGCVRGSDLNRTDPTQPQTRLGDLYVLKDGELQATIYMVAGPVRGDGHLGEATLTIGRPTEGSWLEPLPT